MDFFFLFKSAEAPEQPQQPEMMDMPSMDQMLAEIPEPFLPPTVTIQSPARQTEEIQEGSNKAEILNNIDAGKAYFHEMIPLPITKKKKAASMFISLLRKSFYKQHHSHLNQLKRKNLFSYRIMCS